MNEFDPERFEVELQTLKPAQPPRDLLNRVLEELSAGPERDRLRREFEPTPWDWWSLFRWLAPLAAVVLVLAVVYFEQRSQSRNQPQIPRLVSSSGSVLKADKVEIDQQWLADFDAVGRLPSGEPVRFRCQQWMDKIRLRDSASGLVIERRSPRLEIVPVSFETY